MPAQLQSDNENLLTQCAGTLRRASRINMLTDAMVSGAATRANLKTRIDAAVLPSDQEGFKATVFRSIDVSGLTDADIASVSTVAGLLALFPNTDASNQSVLD